MGADDNSAEEESQAGAADSDVEAAEFEEGQLPQSPSQNLPVMSRPRASALRYALTNAQFTADYVYCLQVPLICLASLLYCAHHQQHVSKPDMTA